LRRKGTPAALEDFAAVVTGLTARVVEGWQVTTWAQRLGHPAPLRPAALDLRDGSRHRVGTPFDRSRHSVTPGGPWAPRAVTAVVWPWQVRTLVEVEAAPLPDAGRFALHPLGAEAPLYLRPRPLRLAMEGGDQAAARTGDEADAPVRATFDVIESLAGPADLTYGAVLTVADTHRLADVAGGGTPPLLRLRTAEGPVPWSALRFASLPPGPPSVLPAAGQVQVDPQRGAVQLGSGLTAPVTATWHRPVGGQVGAFGSTVAADPGARAVVTVDPDGSGPTVRPTIAAALTLAATLAAGLDPESSVPGRPDVEIRLQTSRRLAAPPPVTVTPGVPRWRVVAPWPMTPTIVGDLELDLPGACLELAGFLLSGALVVGPRLDGIHLDGLTMDPGQGGLRVADDAWEVAVSANRCILGPVRADLAATPLVLRECIVDGLGRRLRPCGGDPGGTAVDAVAPVTRFGPVLHAADCTFAGAVRADAVDALDCLFVGGVAVVQRQQGCLRHCYLGPDLTTSPAHPTTYRCGPFPRPAFVSTGFEAGGYFCLDLDPAQPLLSAASDGGEVGAYHRTRRGPRLRRLAERIEEFVPLGLRAEVAVAPWEER